MAWSDTLSGVSVSAGTLITETPFTKMESVMTTVLSKYQLCPTNYVADNTSKYGSRNSHNTSSNGHSSCQYTGYYTGFYGST